MNSLKIQILGAWLGVSWGMINWLATPAIAREPKDTKVNRHHNPASSTPSVARYSSRAIDLFPTSLDTPQTDNVNNTERSVAQRPADEPEMERSPIPVPVPPPAPPAGTPNTGRERGNRTKSGWAIVPEVSSLGLGGNIVTRITPNFNARLGINAFGVGLDVEETEFDYEGDLNLFNVSTVIDFHPFTNSGFRISGGLIFNDNNIEGTADISEQVAEELGEVEVSGQIIDLRELGVEELATVDAEIDLTNSVAPYLGIGGGNPVGASKGWGFWWNLGVAFGGSPEAEVSSNVSDDVPDAIRTEVEAAADRVLEDEEQDLEDELDLIRIYPVLSLGFSYQF